MPYQIELKPLQYSSDSSELDWLAKDWCALAELAPQSSYFLSWSWIKTWLSQQSKQTLWLIQAKDKSGQTLGLGIFVKKSVLKFGFISTTQLWLHKVGDEKSDQMWIEHNDFLLAEHVADDLRTAILQYLYTQNVCQWHELRWDMHPDGIGANWPELDMHCHQVLTSKGYHNQLQRYDDISQGFSKNTRRQVNRAKSLLEAQGQLNLELASDAKQKQAWLAQIAELHKQQWQDTAWGSGFDNHCFVEFHNRLIEQNDTDIIALTLNGDVLAFGYNFRQHQSVCFYLSTIKKFEDNRIKVGLLLHTLAMQHYQNLGFRTYDFLAGDMRYKASLSDCSYTLVSDCLYKQRHRFCLDRLLRQIKNTIERTIRRT
ncbi:GNAT family N-acetyltransferase [Catenovulum sp. SM1970]|uniref:GNAT family N-acetyltransferase n=1 Tax=Marinifaba aquimaris TaxID=2741323 RepID=UPI00157240B9|nr:GNAT family N-acetyltransferase [Marinifaba aquimaris]NTS78270.1 GNAT family N-acetyltransferase [Marinifaba aquimaris]